MFSPPLDLGDQLLHVPSDPKHNSRQSELIKVLTIMARESNPRVLGGEPAPYLPAMATTLWLTVYYGTNSFFCKIK